MRSGQDIGLWSNTRENLGSGATTYCYSSKMFLVLFAPLRRSSSLWSLMKSHSQIAGIMNKVKKRNASISTPFFRVGSRFGIRISLISTSKYLIKTIGVSRLTAGGIKGLDGCGLSSGGKKSAEDF
jgi:hypothetical protein